MGNGFFMIDRSIMETKVYQDNNMAKMILWLSFRASYKERTEMFNGCAVKLKKGDLVTSLREIGTELKLTQRNTRTCLCNLEKLNFLTIKATKKYTVITITNSNGYKDLKNGIDKVNDKEPTKKRQRADTLTDKEATHSIYSNIEKRNKEERINTPLTPQGGKKKSLKQELLIYLKQKIVEENLIDYQPLIIEFFKYRMDKPAKERYKTERQINGLFRDLRGCMDMMYPIDQCLEIAMEKGWQTPHPKYFKNEFTYRQEQIPLPVQQNKISQNGYNMLQYDLSDVFKEQKGELT